VISGGRGAPEAAASAFDDPPDRGEHALAHPLVEAAHIELDDGFLRNDVLLGASLQRTDGAGFVWAIARQVTVTAG
jgi:hypothetical protein